MINQKKIHAALLCAVLLLGTLAFGSCGKAFHDFEFVYFGDAVRVHIPTGDYDVVTLTAGCEALAQEHEILLAPEGEGFLARFNDGADQVADAKLGALFTLALSLHDDTDGRFDVTGGMSEGLSVTAEGVIRTDPRVRADLGAMANGALVKEVMAYLSEQGVPYGQITVAGGTAVFGLLSSGNPWTVQILDPHEDDMLGYMMLEEGFVATRTDAAAPTDPATGKPVDNGVYSVVVLSKDPVLADALAEACFLMGYDEALELYSSGEYVFEALFYTRHGIKMTDHFSRSFWQKDVAKSTQN